MGDYPSRQAWPSLELTDHIFSSALQDSVLQDEVYCQILKQLTQNTKRSVGRGRGVGDTGPSVFVLAPKDCLWQQLMEATQPAQAPSVAVEWAGRPACPADSLGGQSREGSRPSLALSAPIFLPLCPA